MPRQPKPILLSVPEAAEMLDRTADWVWNKISQGETFGDAVIKKPHQRIKLSRLRLRRWIETEAASKRRLISVAEASKLLGCDSSRLHRLIREEDEDLGGAVILQPGKRIQIDEDLLRHHIDGDLADTNEPDTAKAS